MSSLDEVKSLIKDLPISQIIGQYISLRKQGANYMGLCPFHADTKPSLSVSDEKGIFKCFVCDNAGDAIGFVTKRQGLGFVEAIKEIAKNNGLPYEDLDNKKNENPQFKLAKRVMEASFKVFHKFTKEQKPKAFSDFLEQRKLNLDSVENFGLVYAPPGNVLLNFFQNKKFESEKEQSDAIAMAMDVHLLGEKDGRKYDFFRDRIMFPIHDQSGQIRGYTARSIHKDQNPKYLNSKDSPFFSKGHILYGLFIAKNHIRQKDAVIVVEGNMDVIMLHQYGFKHTVAIMGTGFTEYNLNTLTKMTRNFYLALDNDDAGWKSMTRANEACLRVGIVPKLLSYAPAKDGDEFLLKFGQIALQEKIDSAPLCIDAMVEKIIPVPIPETTDHKLRILKSVFQILSPLGNHLLAKEKAIQAAKTLGLKSREEDIVEEYLKEASRESIKELPNTKVNSPVLSDLPILEAQTVPTKPENSKNAKGFLKKLILHPEIVSHSSFAQVLDFLGHSEVQRIVQWIGKIYFEIIETEFESVVRNFVSDEKVSEEIRSIVLGAFMDTKIPKLNEKEIGKLLSDCLVELKTEELQNKLESLRALRENAVTDLEQTEAVNKYQIVLTELNELKKKKKP